MTLYKTVKSWVDEKQTFLAEPVQLGSLIQARQKVHDYSVSIVIIIVIIIFFFFFLLLFFIIITTSNIIIIIIIIIIMSPPS
jgi:hypothetical protein